MCGGVSIICSSVSLNVKAITFLVSPDMSAVVFRRIRKGVLPKYGGVFKRDISNLVECIPWSASYSSVGTPLGFANSAKANLVEGL